MAPACVRSRSAATACSRSANRSTSAPEELRGLALLLGIGLPVTLLLASVAGSLVARSALRPVEEMRRRAETMDEGDRLLPAGTGDELDRLATTLNELLGRRDASLERERRMIGEASHELRTPISVLRTRLDVALRGDADAASLRAALYAAQGDARRLSRLADDLLLLARADQGRIPLRPAPLDVQDLLEEAVQRAAALAPGADPVVLGDGIPGGAVLLADPDRAAQAVDNLISNARAHGAAPIVVSARAGDGSIHITVRDHGAGMPEEFVAAALERFSQAKLTGEGTGLGLAITDALMQAQGGAIELLNHPGEGLEATLRFPAA